MKLANAIGELNPDDDFRQPVPAVQFSPFFLRGHLQPEGHGGVGLPAEAAFGAHRPVPDHRGGTLDWVRGADVFPMFCREAAEACRASRPCPCFAAALSHFAPWARSRKSQATDAAARVSACQMSCRCRLAFRWSDLGSALSMFMVLRTRHHCSRVTGNASRSAIRNPRAPSVARQAIACNHRERPIASFGSCLGQRRLRSRSTSHSSGCFPGSRRSWPGDPCSRIRQRRRWPGRTFFLFHPLPSPACGSRHGPERARERDPSE